MLFKHWNIIQIKKKKTENRVNKIITLGNEKKTVLWIS